MKRSRHIATSLSMRSPVRISAQTGTSALLAHVHCTVHDSSLLFSIIDTMFTFVLASFSGMHCNSALPFSQSPADSAGTCLMRLFAARVLFPIYRLAPISLKQFKTLRRNFGCTSNSARRRGLHFFIFPLMLCSVMMARSWSWQ